MRYRLIRSNNSRTKVLITKRQIMEQQEDTFEITVEPNPGLEPLTFTIMAKENPLSAHELEFNIQRYQDHLGTIKADSNHCWKLIDGKIKQDEVDAIGAAIDAHYR
jgi:hypothetical protein